MTETLNSEAEFFLQQALRYSATGQYEQVVASYEKALEIQPDLYETWNNLGNTLFSLNRNEEAKLLRSRFANASYDKALAIEPNLAQTWYNRGRALEHLGQLEEAITSYDKATEIKPDFYEAWINQGIALR